MIDQWNDVELLRKVNIAAFYYIDWLEHHVPVFAIEDEEDDRQRLRDGWRTAFEATLPTADAVRGILGDAS